MPPKTELLHEGAATVDSGGPAVRRSSRHLSIIIVFLGTIGSLYCGWALHRISANTLAADSNWPRPWPYPDGWLTAMHDLYDARYPGPPGTIKIHGELLRVRLTVGAALAFWFITVVVGVAVRLSTNTVVGNCPQRLRRLKGLLFTHLAVLTCCAVFTDVNDGSGMDAGINILFTALVGSELCLLGLGIAAVVQWPPRWTSLSFLAKGMSWVWLVTLFVLVRTGLPPPPFLLLLPPFVSLAALGFGLLMRGRGIALVSATDALGDASEPLQFTLRRLLTWVSATAVLLAIARGLHSTASLQLSGIAHTLAVLGVMSLLTAGIVLATLWATLGVGRPVQRLPVAISLAAIGGLAPAYCFDRPSPWAYLGLAIVAVMLSAIAAATLLAVRQCGYRLGDTTRGRE